MNNKDQKMIFRKDWNDFRDSGFIWFINTILHVFGWALVCELGHDKRNKNKVVNVFPARVKFRGFTDDCNTAGYVKVSKFMKAHATKLLKEAQS